MSVERESSTPKAGSSAGHPARDQRVERAKKALAGQHEGLAKIYADEEIAIRARREKAFLHSQFDKAVPRAGLALSGGGIRSATFCLGLIQGLARNGLLRRFDFLSTVSGGGYIGACVSRLVEREGIDQAEKLLASNDSQVIGWLRKNGRYLTPAGARDIGIALATLMRSWLSTHFELGLLALLVGVWTILPHAIQSEFTLLDANAWQAWPSAWWPVAATLWLAVAPGCMLAYWPLRDPVKLAAQRGAERFGDFAIAFVAAVIAADCLWHSYKPVDGAWIPSYSNWTVVLIASLSAIGMGLYARNRVSGLRRKSEDIAEGVGELRHDLTKYLRSANLLAFWALVLGLVDALSYSFVRYLEFGNKSISGLTISVGVGVLGVLVAAMRSLSEPLQKYLSSSTGSDSGQWVAGAINAIGQLLGLVLVFGWVSFLQWLVFFEDDGNIFFHGIPAAWALVVVLVPTLMWVLWTGRNIETVNASTLHGFYRGRLIRAYLSIGNANRFPDLAPRTRGPVESAAVSVVDEAPGDDVDIVRHRPEAKGGAIHLVGTTLNQTIDDHGDLYNADRKGSAVIASARGIEVGPAEGQPWAPDYDATLGEWVTISGAAASPGAGSNTTRGWALLLFLFGVRLGYWKQRLVERVAPLEAKEPNFLAKLFSRFRDSKSGLVMSEALASFLGRPAKWWYLSDGGHFENTGVYALLKRRLPFIMLADCGADPNYVFEDIENLIRKARIDFDAEIELLTADCATAHFGPWPCNLEVLSPEDVIKNHTRRGVLLARICYNSSKLSEHEFGTLVIVKPNLHEWLDADVLAYARRKPTFPQQSTAEQFFDESQWESYRRLGEDFGACLKTEWLTQLPSWINNRASWSGVGQLAGTRSSSASRDVEVAAPYWRRGAVAAVGTTVSVSAITALATLVWNGIDHSNKAPVAPVRTQDILSTFSALTRGLCEVDKLYDALSICAEAPRKVADNQSVSQINIQRLQDVYASVRATNNLNVALVDATQTIKELQGFCSVGDHGQCPDKFPVHLADVCSVLCENDVSRDANRYWGWSSKTAWCDGFVATSSTLTRSFPVDCEATALAVAPHIEPDLAAKTDSSKEVTTASLDRPTTLPTTATEAAANAPPSAGVPASVSETTPASASAPAAPSTSAHSSAPPASAAASAQAVAPTTANESGRAMASGSSAGHAPIATSVEGSPKTSVGTDAVATPGAKVACHGHYDGTVYTQIYDEATRNLAKQIVDVLKSCGVDTRPIENVVSTARMKGMQAPFPYRAPTWVVHRMEGDRSAVNDLTSNIAGIIKAAYHENGLQARALPKMYQSDKAIVELWLPPVQTTD